MAKNDNVKSKGTASKGQVRDGHSVGDHVRAWQPTVDRTTKPPKKSSTDKK